MELVVYVKKPMRRLEQKNQEQHLFLHFSCIAFWWYLVKNNILIES